jgi:hypothetical protein
MRMWLPPGPMWEGEGVGGEGRGGGGGLPSSDEGTDTLVLVSLRTKLFLLALNSISKKKLIGENVTVPLMASCPCKYTGTYLSYVVNRMSSDPSTVTPGEGFSPWPTAGLTPTNHSSSSPTGNFHSEKLYCFT